MSSFSSTVYAMDSNLLHPVLFFADTCYEGDVRLSNGSYVYYLNGYTESSGRVEVCVNGEFIDVCSGSINVEEVCSYLGYPGTVLNKEVDTHCRCTDYCRHWLFDTYTVCRPIASLW